MDKYRAQLIQQEEDKCALLINDEEAAVCSARAANRLPSKLREALYGSGTESRSVLGALVLAAASEGEAIEIVPEVLRQIREQ